MLTAKKPYVITRGKVIVDYSGLYCDTPEQLLRSELFEETVDRFIERIATRESSIFAFLKNNLHGLKRNELTGYIVNLFRLLSSHTAEEIIAMKSEFRTILAEKEYLHEFIEELYNYWRRFRKVYLS